MMKSFFKKLASVLALAMVVSLAAPAAQTAAAAEAKEFTYKYQTGIGAAVKTVNLAKTGDTVDLKFVGIPDYAKYELNWMAVGTGFELDQTGVLTATADEGEGVVWLSVGDDQTYVSDPIKVTIGELKATIGTQDKSNKALEGATIKVNEKMDLAFYGITDWNLGKYGYKWVVGDTSVLDVDQKTGEITGLKAGETTITFMAPNKFNQANVVVTNALKVTVLPDAEPAIEAVQKSQNNFEILFTDLIAANYTDNNIEVVRIAPADKDMDGNGVIDKNDFLEETFFIKPTSADKDNNKFVVDTYADFVDGATYEVRVGDYKDQFVASVGAVARIELSATEGVIASDGVAAVPAKLSVKLFDKNGINVTTVVTDGIINSDRIVYGIKGADANKVYQYGNEVTFIEEGVVTATAYYDCYNITETNKVEASVNVIGKKHADYIAKVIAWKAVKAGDKINWADVVANNEPLWVASEDDGYYIVALLEDSRGNYFTTHVEGTTDHTDKKFNNKVVYAMDFVDQAIGSSYVFAANGYTLEFETLNPDNLLMYKDGAVVTYKEVTSYIKLNLYNIYSDAAPTELATVPLLVKPARYVKYLEADKTTVAAVTDTYLNEFDDQFTNASVKIKVFDQYNAKWYGYTNYELTAVLDNTYTDSEKQKLADYAKTVVLPAEGSGVQEFDVKFNTKTIRNLLDDYFTANGNTNKSNRNVVSFKLTEKNSGRFVTIRVNLQVPNYEGNDEINGEVKLDAKRTNNLSVYDHKTYGTVVEESAFFDWSGFVTATRQANIDLYVSSKSYNVGYDKDELVVYNGSMKTADYTDAIAAGTKVLVVTGPNNKAVLETATPGALGVHVNTNTTADGVTYYTYSLLAATPGENGAKGEMQYLATGRYTVQVRTVEKTWVDNNGVEWFSFVTASDTSKTTNVKYITVTRNNDAITLTGQVTRDLRESADTIEEVVADAFTFNRGGNAWYTGDKLENLVDWVDFERGDDYVYIKSVTFKVPVDKTEYTTEGYYLYKVNVGRSVKVSTDLFY